MDDQNKNLLLATVLSFVVIVGWYMLFPPPEPAPSPETPAAVTEGGTAAPPPVPGVSEETPATPEELRAEALGTTIRIPIDTPRLRGSISLQGGRIDDLSLKDYKVSLEPGADEVTLLAPVGGPQAHYALYGWVPGGELGFEDVPGANTPWELESGTTLSPGNPVTLRWDNGKGLIFRRVMEVDENFLFSVAQTVENASGAEVRLAPYGVIARHGLPEQMNFFILHEGVVQMADGTLTEIDYDDMPDMNFVEREGARAEVAEVTENGWIGFTDHYWMTALMPAPGSGFTAAAKYVASAEIFQTEARFPAVTVAPGETARSDMALFAGAKEWEAIRDYQNEGGIDRFLDAIDWGWFFFLTKPIFAALHWLNAQIGNMGLAIIALTFVIKAILFPLARKSYVSMARMRELQPEMEKLKERAGDDRQKLQKEMMELYKKEKVNPAAGCLPILLQIPIFFSLYKVIFVTLELRHAPFFGWIRDLSAPDPSSIYNLFGLLPWAAPEPTSFMALIFIGVLPLLLGISMWLQQKLNPAPTDPTQAMIFAYMPWIFMFMLGSFASGLIIYWIANNVITFTQQYLIMWSHGHRPDLFGNIRKGFSRKKPEAAAPEPKKKPGKK